ncbi:MAG: purine/pyrimidine permease [Firmicutes bacterium]|nr:purine/pyrimidine permease [Bacillota bacterium]
MSEKQIVYQLDDIPKPFSKAFALGLQHVLTAFGATVAVPLLIAPAMGMDAQQTALLVAASMLSAGIATLLQVNLGTRLPIIQGMSFAFLGPYFAIISMVAAHSSDVATIMSYITGAIILGSLIEMVIGFSGLIGKVTKYLTPVVIGPVVTMIGLSLYSAGAPQAGENWFLSGLVIALIFFFSLVVSRRKPMASSFSILLSVIIVYLIAVILTVTGVYTPDTPGYVDFSPIANAQWFRLNLFFPWGTPKFDFSFVLVILAGYLASIIESYGDYHSVAAVAGVSKITGKQISRGIAMEGLACFIGGFLGGPCNTSYSENIALVGLTGVASRYVVNVGAGILIFLGIFAKFGAAVATIPSPIVGGLYCSLFGLIAAVGVSNAAKADLSSMRNLMIMGFIMFMGLSVPAYFSGLEAAGTPFVIEGAEWLSDIITTIGKTSMAVTAILGLILDNLIPGTPEERGIVAKS